MQRPVKDYGWMGQLPEEKIVEELEMQKASLERDREIAHRRAAATQQAKNLREDIEKLGAKPVR